MISLKQKNIPNFQQESPFKQLEFLVIQCWQCTQCTENQTPAALTSSATSLLSRVNQHPITPPHKSPECWMIIYLETRFIRVTQYFTPLALEGKSGYWLLFHIEGFELARSLHYVEIKFFSCKRVVLSRDFIYNNQKTDP